MNRGLVIKSTGSWYSVLSDDDLMIDCKLKGKFKIKGIKSTNPIAVGDYIRYQIVDGIGIINKIEDRKNYIIRKSTNLSKQTHIIASNIDQALLLVSLVNPRTTIGFIDRFLITAEAYEITTILAFNKIDIYDSELMKELDFITKIYTSIGYQVVHISAKANINLEHVKAILKDKKTLLSGHSGVGKSALVNALDHTKTIKIGEISLSHSKGKHTTTNACMYSLIFGAFIIDTPGIKEFGLTGFHRHELGHFFPEMRELLGKCKFNNCLHENEKDCAVITAVKNGKIHENRYKSYLHILQDEDLLQWENQFRES
ncbi:MAG: ribosome small subunit-dependent GTPase A [Bacteroidetes bacterium CG2_30_33_31]|nr:MAG: ribosome small subunit-dependent GTPase A [Bacteroidetes bacterium CG2_30_33_31]